MASTSTAAVASSSSATLMQESRPEAGPLPSKRGEIGFVDGVHEQTQATHPVDVPDPLPARHPADRAPVPSPPDPIHETSSHSLPHPETPRTPPDADDTPTSIIGKRSFLGSKRLPKFMGIQFMTTLLLCIQLLLFAGTMVGWVFAALAISGRKNNPPQSGPGTDQNAPSPPPPPDMGSSSIFVHVAFAVVALAQIVLLERRIFRARAERYVFKHPGAMLPTSLRRAYSGSSTSMSIAPWSRPPLPSYAAALAASGVGTGDVEDMEIAQPPPPAYGKTRGSTLILAGYLRNSLRVQAREHEEDRRASGRSLRSDRPISFVSRDEDWEERRDADRARRIEEALAALEDSRPVLRDPSERISSH